MVAYSVQKYKDFRNRDFDELYEYASTPKSSSETKMGRKQEENESKKKHKQYG